jgi:hypothetical protein
MQFFAKDNLQKGVAQTEETARRAPKKYKTETWYDRHTRSWVTQIFENGNQFGDAQYSGCKSERDFNKAQAEKFVNANQ